jgi:hypothetical protein
LTTPAPPSLSKKRQPQQPPASPESAWDFSNVKDEPAPEPEKACQEAAEPAKEEPPKLNPIRQPTNRKRTRSLRKPLVRKDRDETEKDEKEKPDSEEAIDKQDPEEMKKAQRNATAKSYLERAEKVYTPGERLQVRNDFRH